MKRIIGVLIASMFLSTAFAADAMKDDVSSPTALARVRCPPPFCLRQFLCIFPVVFRRFQSSNAVFNVNFSAAGGV